MFTYCPQCKADIKKIGKRYECTTCTFCYYTNPVAAAEAVIYNKENEIILTKRAKDPQKGYWELPGGFVDFNESAEQGLKREIKEELGISLKHITYIGSYPNTYTYKEITYHPLDIAFKALSPDIKWELEKEEIIEAQFFSQQNIPHDKLAFPVYNKIINDFFNSLK